MIFFSFLFLSSLYSPCLYVKVAKRKGELLLQVDLGLWLKRGGCSCEWPCCLLPPLGFSLWRCKGRWGFLGEIAHVTFTYLLTRQLLCTMYVRTWALNEACMEWCQR